MLSVGVSLGEFCFEFGGSAESNFLGALDDPVFEDVAASGVGGGVDGGGVWSA